MKFVATKTSKRRATMLRRFFTKWAAPLMAVLWA
jgi:hypothetical protein